MEELLKKYMEYLNAEFRVEMNEEEILTKKNELISISGGDIEKANFIVNTTIYRGEIMFSEAWHCGSTAAAFKNSF